MATSLKLLNRLEIERIIEKRTLSEVLMVIIVCMFAVLPWAAVAAPMSSRAFDDLASACASKTSKSLLRAVAGIESRLDPLAIGDSTTHRSWSPKDLLAAASMARKLLAEGHSIDVGLMQINGANLIPLGLTVESAFEPCRSLAAAQAILSSAFAAGSSEAERHAAILISLSRYNTGRTLSGIANGYANRVVEALSARPVAFDLRMSGGSPRSSWNVWGSTNREPRSWVVTATEFDEIVRAGAQPTSARVEGRAAVPLAARGEPYELLAYQESRPPKP
jgi:type IV secretion system protein VirB1